MYIRVWVDTPIKRHNKDVSNLLLYHDMGQVYTSIYTFIIIIVYRDIFSTRLSPLSPLLSHLCHQSQLYLGRRHCCDFRSCFFFMYLFIYLDIIFTICTLRLTYYYLCGYIHYSETKKPRCSYKTFSSLSLYDDC